MNGVLQRAIDDYRNGHAKFQAALLLGEFAAQMLGISGEDQTDFVEQLDKALIDRAVPVSEIVNLNVRSIIEGYKDAPPIFHWDEPNISAYDMGKDKIFMALKQSHPRFYSILLHELTHSTNHSSRLNRQRFKDFKADSICLRTVAIEELIADTGRLVLLDYAGLPFTKRDADSVQSHVKHHADDFKVHENRDIGEVQKEIMPQVQAAMEYILGKDNCTGIDYDKYLFSNIEKLITPPLVK